MNPSAYLDFGVLVDNGTGQYTEREVALELIAIYEFHLNYHDKPELLMPIAQLYRELAEHDDEFVGEFIDSMLDDVLTPFLRDYTSVGYLPDWPGVIGVYPCIDLAKEDMPTFDAGTNIPPDLTEWLEVNDHGNVSLYARNNDQVNEVWSCV